MLEDLRVNYVAKKDVYSIIMLILFGISGRTQEFADFWGE